MVRQILTYIPMAKGFVYLVAGWNGSAGNIFIERLWRSLKYEKVYISAYDPVAEASRGLGVWLAFYNDVRPRQSLDYQTPREVFEGEACEHVDNIRIAARHSNVARMLTGASSGKGSNNELLAKPG